MLVLKLGQVIHILVNDNIEVVGFVVGCHIGSGERFGHIAGNEYYQPLANG